MKYSKAGGDFVGIVILAVLGLNSAGHAQAQQAPEVRAWGEDNCLYSWDGRQWMRQVHCRILDQRNPKVWDVYSSADPQRNLVMRVDESYAGWVYAYFPNQPTMAWRVTTPEDVLFVGNDPNAIFVHDAPSGVWVSVAQMRQTEQQIRSLLKQLEEAKRQAAAQGGPPLKPGEIAPNVRENIPIDPSLQTPEEKRYVHQVNQGIVTGSLGGISRRICENRGGYYDSLTGLHPKVCY